MKLEVSVQIGWRDLMSSEKNYMPPPTGPLSVRAEESDSAASKISFSRNLVLSKPGCSDNRRAHTRSGPTL